MRLIERKLDALTQVLHATASSDTAEALLEKLVDALLELFPQAEDVGVLVEDERTRRAQGRSASAIASRAMHGEPIRAAHDHAARPKKPFGGELRVPGTIIQHVVSDRRGVLLGETRRRRRRGASARAWARRSSITARTTAWSTSRASQQAFRQEDVDLLQAIATQAGLAIHATRVAAQLARREKLERDLRVARQIQRSPAAARTCRRSSASTSRSTTSPRIRSAATSTTSSGTTRRTSGSRSATSPARRSAPRSTWRG